ncbi:hypothetical protein [Nannocystis sp.]|uniref:hypothetical protein n=1 Tax=Nannocystis sp. TaxID=1962667 RepID=UPI0024245BBE|nr:hypothetical protein [Nannocystis sp.]MBK7827524.1 hypothetical protein [Nannocystis sp.]MBK9756402.1 hypothetical protein [Nannocystis sp.]
MPLLLSFACAGPADGSTDGTSSGDTGSTDTGGDTPTTTGAPSGAPMVMELLASAPSLTENEAIILTAIVVDPDGLDTIVAGKLTSEDGSVYYGAFAHMGGGTYQLPLSWEQLGMAEKIDFNGYEQMRVLKADFQDIDGNHGERTIAIKLTCDTPGACDGTCTDLLEDDHNCGQCGETCLDFMYGCKNGECTIGG